MLKTKEHIRSDQVAMDEVYINISRSGVDVLLGIDIRI